MFTQIFDTHSHYTDSAFDEDRDQVLGCAPERGHRPRRSRRNDAGGQCRRHRTDQALRLPLCRRRHPPGDRRQQPADYLAQLERMAADPRVVAVGEIGLDYHYEGYDRDVQIRLFREQLDLAKQLDLPVIIHARDCTEDYVNILREMRPVAWYTAFPAVPRPPERY